MADNLFGGLPPPSSASSTEQQIKHDAERSMPPDLTENREPSETAPAPALKSALKRRKPAESTPQAEAPPSEKRLRFKTTTDASEQQVIEAMQKITSHIKNPAKFAKASKLAIQLIKSGSVKPGTKDHFFSILQAAMSSSPSCTDASVRADYHALFSGAQEVAEFLDKKQRNLLTTWTIRAVVANDLFTDDSFVFSKTAGRIKEAISELPVSTPEDDLEEANALKDDEVENTSANDQTTQDFQVVLAEDNNAKNASDPFGLDALIPDTGRKESKMRGKRDGSVKGKNEDEEERKRFLKSQREALITCLEIAAHRYRVPWCQTVIDILVKHAFDSISRFTPKQRDAVEKLWASIREQQIRRKQGKSVTGKLDVTAFEWLQQKYANEKMSIRHSVGGGGDRRAEQWLG